MISKLKYNRNGKEPVTHKTVTETKLIFETEISLVRRRVTTLIKTNALLLRQ